jgi:hypothetical protein
VSADRTRPAARLARAGATESRGVPKSSGRKCERRKLVRTYWELNGESVDRDDQQHGDEATDPIILGLYDFDV